MYHFYTTSADGVTGLVNSGEGWSLEGIACFVYKKQDPEEGLSTYPRHVPQLIPLYRCYHDEHNDHLYTTHWNEVQSACDAGYIYEFIEAWVFPVDTPDFHSPFLEVLGFKNSDASWLRTTPFYRLYRSETGEHFYTIDEQERDYAASVGYEYEMVACRVLKTPPPSGVYPAAATMFRLINTKPEEAWYEKVVGGAKWVWDQIPEDVRDELKKAVLEAILIALGVGGGSAETKRNPETGTIDAALIIEMKALLGTPGYGLKSVSGWQQFELAVAGSASVKSVICAVSRIQNSIEIWWIGMDGSVQNAYWYEGGNWQRQTIAPAGSASIDSCITAVSRIPSSMEIFWIGPDASVQDAYWYEGQDSWKQFEIAPAGSASLNSGITAISRIPNSIEIWWVGANGSVQDAYWYEGQDSWKQFEIAPGDSASIGTSIAAVSRIPNSLEIWWVGANGSVQDAYWYEGQDGWRQFEIAPAGSAWIFGGITALSRIPSSLEIWWIGADGSVQDAYWYEGQDSWRQFEIAPAFSASLGKGITSVSRNSTSMEIFWVGVNGSVQDATWSEGQYGWRQFELAPDGSVALGGCITAVSRIPESMEIWWVGTNGSIHDAFVYA